MKNHLKNQWCSVFFKPLYSSISPICVCSKVQGWFLHSTMQQTCQPMNRLSSLKGIYMVAVKPRRSQPLYSLFPKNNELLSGLAFLKRSHLLLTPNNQEENSWSHLLFYDVTSTHNIIRMKPETS